MIEKCRLMYKGDMIAGSFYIFMGIILFIFAFILHYYTISLGYQYLSIGFFIFFLYAVGKGAFIYYISLKRFRYYLTNEKLTDHMLRQEAEYSEYRANKKVINRRRYIWTMVFGCLISFIGIFSKQKGLIMGTAIPIALISGIEFGIELLTEFRLREFLRILKKETV